MTPMTGLRRLVALGGHIAAAVVEASAPYIRLAVLASKWQCAASGLRISTSLSALDVAGRHFAGAVSFDAYTVFGALAVQLGDNALDIEDDLRYILLDAAEWWKTRAARRQS